jgi:F-type H+-transporting ATPase subunit c
MQKTCIDRTIHQHQVDFAKGVNSMEVEAARLIGAGLAAIGAGAAAAGVGYIWGSFLQGALRNPEAANGEQARLYIGFAVTELLGLIAAVIGFILLFG